MDSLGLKILTEAGLNKEEAMLAVVAIKAGHMEMLTETQRAVLTGKGYQQVREDSFVPSQNIILAGAKSAFGSVTAKITEVANDPMLKLAAGLGAMAWSYRREVKSVLAVTKSWAALAASYLKWAGIEKFGEAKGILSSLKPTKANLKKGALGTLLVAGSAAALSYGVGKIAETDWTSKKPEDQAKDMMGGAASSPIAKDLTDYLEKNKD